MIHRRALSSVGHWTRPHMRGVFFTCTAVAIRASEAHVRNKAVRNRGSSFWGRYVRNLDYAIRFSSERCTKSYFVRTWYRHRIAYGQGFRLAHRSVVLIGGIIYTVAVCIICWSMCSRTTGRKRQESWSRLVFVFRKWVRSMH